MFAFLSEPTYATYVKVGEGKCITKSNESPFLSYHHNLSMEGNCQDLCTKNENCFGYSFSDQNNNFCPQLRVQHPPAAGCRGALAWPARCKMSCGVLDYPT